MPLIHHRPQQFLLTWLGDNFILNLNPNYEEELNKLGQIFTKVDIVQTCYHILDTEKYNESSRPVILIAWEPSSPKCVVKLASESIVSFVFIFGSNIYDDDYKNCPKLRGILTNFAELIDALKRILSTTTDPTHWMISSTTEINQSTSANSNDMIYLPRLNDFASVPLDEESLINGSRPRFNTVLQTKFRPRHRQWVESFSFRTNDENRRNLIQWFSANPEFSYYVNDVWRSRSFYDLRNLEVFFRLMTEHLKKENLQKSTSLPDELRFYRGERVDQDYIEQITTHQNHFISFKGFWSASLYENVAKKTFENRTMSDLNNVLFIVQIDRKLPHHSMFANVSHLTSNPDDGDILFSIGSIFRIESIEFNSNESFYTIVLTLIEDNRLVIEMLLTSSNDNEEDRRSEQLIDLANFFFFANIPELALESLLKFDVTHIDRRYFSLDTYFINISICYSNLGESHMAEEWLDKCLEVLQKSPNAKERATTLHQLAIGFSTQKRYETAERLIREAITLSLHDKLNLANYLESYGSIYLEQSKFAEAEKKYYEAFRMRKDDYECYNNTHSSIADSAKKLANFYANQGRLHTALGFYRYAAEIYNQNSFFSDTTTSIALHISSIESRLRS